MALWADSKLLFSCILFITFCCSMTRAQMAIDCCLSVSQKSIGKGRIVDYQDQAKGCSVAAKILVTRTGRNLCAPLNEKWVLDVMDHVDRLKKRCKKNNYQGTRCRALRH
ncbi:C-C motif chemokine 4 [Austrofundulus limnaeus]|uniref:C-C motif chemokine 4 n=1 Tax=Austrofundulus limnaeus TaxID=52670 RepID=A0A2I4C566_AUSLI|nr:PREDICTED: C-C motif chemokine 4-like [Austrofundulus limnaeus]